MDLVTIALLLISLTTVLFYWLWRNDSSIAKEFAQRNIKYVKLTNLFKAMFTREQVHLTKDVAIKREGPVFGFSLLNKYTVIIADAEILQTVLSKEFTRFPNRREFPIFDKIFSENIFMVADEKWKRLRSTITPAFSVGKLKQMKPFMDETTQTLLKNIDAKLQVGAKHNVKDFFNSFTIDTIIQVAFGVKVDSLNDSSNPIIEYGKKIFSTDPTLFQMAKMTLAFMIPQVTKYIDVSLLDEASHFFTKMSTDIMDQKRAEFINKNGDKDSSKPISFIECMLEAEEEGRKMLENERNGITDAPKPSKYMTTDEVVSQAVLFFLAGFETTATAITLTVYHLAQYPDIQEKLHKEVVSIIEQLKLENPTEKDLFKLITYDVAQSKFEYLNAVINETLRFDSPIIFVERTASLDTELSIGEKKFTVKKDDVLHVPVWSIHHNPEYFPEPNKFLPDRFLGEPTFPKYAYLPFGAGPRNCVARSMALLEARLALLHVVRNYRFELCEETKLHFVNQFDMIVPKEMMLRITKR